jgi:4-amino-4-deoxy-L-arabinose transferase-like glycosyltransferase
MPSLFLGFCFLVYFILVAGAYVFWRRNVPALFHLFFWPALLATILLVILHLGAVENNKRYGSPQAIFESEFHQKPTGNILAGDWSPGADFLYISLDFQSSPDELKTLIAKMQMHQINFDEFISQASSSDAKVNYTSKDQFYFNDKPLPGHDRAYGSEERFIIYDASQQFAQYRFSGID